MRIRARLITKNFEVEERRKLKGMTQAEFAEAVGMNTNRLQKIEQMRIKPTADEAKSIALELDTQVDILFPKGYEKVVEVFANIGDKVLDYTPPMLDQGFDEVRLLEQADAKRSVEYLMERAKLSPRETQVVVLRSEGDTLEQVATKMDVTRERIRQIEARGLEKMRHVDYETKRALDPEEDHARFIRLQKEGGL